MAKYKPYDKYKPSGIEWLGEVPEHWEEAEIRRLFRNNIEKNEGLIEKNLLSLSYGILKRKDINTTTGLLPASFEGYQIINEGYIVLRFTDLQNDKNSLRVGYAHERGIITSAYVGIAPKTNIYSKYFYHQLHFLDLIKHFYNSGGGVRQSLAFNEFGKEMVVLPPLPEQTSIAHFLDYKLAKINRFIRKKKQLIKLLNEQKAAIINQAVTKGLDPQAQMKDSGIKWLGEVPEHWEVRKLKGILEKSNDSLKPGPFGSDLKNQDIIQEGFKVYTQRAVLDEDFAPSTYSISENKFKELSVFEVREGDILLTTRGTIGRCCIVPKKFEKGVIHPCIIRIRIDRSIVLRQFVKLFIEKSNAFQVALKYNSNATTIDVIYGNVLRDVFFVLPPLSEQHQIIAHIETETALLNTTIAKIEKEIALVEEYKTALIAEAVTGKIDVRGYTVPELADEEDTDTEMEDVLSLEEEEAAEYQMEETA